MSVADVERAVRLVMRTAEEHGPWLFGNVAAVRHALVDPVLWALGWSTWSPAECLLNFKLDQRGPVDYALLDPEGNIAVLVLVGTLPARRSSDRYRLMARTRGINRGVAVLTYGTRWEIYDLRIRARRFSDKMVMNLVLDWDMPHEPEEVAHGLHHWIRRDLWRNDQARRDR